MSDVGEFQRFVDRLIYLTITQFDILYVISLVSNIMHSPRVIYGFHQSNLALSQGVTWKRYINS